MKYEKPEISFVRELFAAMIVIFLLVVMAMMFYLSLPLTPAPVAYPDIAYDRTECHNCTEITPPIPVKYKFEDLIKKKRYRKYGK